MGSEAPTLLLTPTLTPLPPGAMEGFHQSSQQGLEALTAQQEDTKALLRKLANFFGGGDEWEQQAPSRHLSSRPACFLAWVCYHHPTSQAKATKALQFRQLDKCGE